MNITDTKKMCERRSGKEFINGIECMNVVNLVFTSGHKQLFMHSIPLMNS